MTGPEPGGPGVEPASLLREVTFAFIDMERSTTLAASVRQDRWVDISRDLDARFRACIDRFGGAWLEWGGDGYFVTFPLASDALNSAVAIQHLFDKAGPTPLRVDVGGEERTVEVRIGVYKAAREVVREEDGKYRDLEVHLASRVGDLPLGGQIIASESAYRSAGHRFDRWLPHENRYVDNFDEPQVLYELLWDGRSRGAPGSQWMPSFLLRETSSFVGRSDELKEIVRWSRGDAAAGGRCPILLVHGPGGIGKTRLVSQAILAVSGHFKGRIYGRSLDAEFPGNAAATPDRLAQAIARATGAADPVIREATVETVLQDLARRFASSPFLLVLDNFENAVRPDTLEFLAELTARVPTLRCLVTCRVKFDVAGGVAGRSLGRLPIPSHAGEVIGDFDGYVLFRERVEQDTPPRDLSDVASVVKILQATEGSALGIELVAARYRMGRRLTLAAIAEGLGASRLAWQSDEPGGPARRAARRRHSSLEACIDWSFRLLPGRERRRYLRLAIFPSDFDEEAARRVAGIPIASLDRWINSHMLQVEEGRGRLALQAALREFTESRLPWWERIRMRNKHARHYLRLAEEAASRLRGPDQRRWLDRLDDELPNLDAALTWASRHDVRLGLRVATALRMFWWIRGHARLGAARLDALLDAPARIKATADWAAAAAAAGHLARHRGEKPRAEALFAASLRAYRGLEAPSASGEAAVLRHLGVLAWHKHDASAARSYLDEALARSTQGGTPADVAESQYELGNLARSLGEYESAEAHLKASRDVFREAGDRRWVATASLALGNLDVRLDKPEEARRNYAESLRIFAEAKDKARLAMTLERIAALAALRGEPLHAARLLGSAEILREEAGSPLPEPDRSEYHDRLVAGLRETLGTSTGPDRPAPIPMDKALDRRPDLDGFLADVLGPLDLQA